MASTGRGSKQKGANYERAIAKKLTDWWIPKGSDLKFNRVPASGALDWGSDHRVAGDIVPPNGLYFPFVVECKKQEDWTMDHVLLNIGKPKDWWSQAVTDSRRVEKIPMLIFSRNRAKDFVMIPYNGSLYKELDSLSESEQDVMRTTVTFKDIRDEYQSFDVIVTTFDTLSQISSHDIRNYAKLVEDTWDDYADQYKQKI